MVDSATLDAFMLWASGVQDQIDNHRPVSHLADAETTFRVEGERGTTMEGPWVAAWWGTNRLTVSSCFLGRSMGIVGR